jgi:hypothetical protein
MPNRQLEKFVYASKEAILQSISFMIYKYGTLSLSKRQAPKPLALRPQDRA